MKIVVSLLLIISVATFFSVGNASPAVKWTYNPAKVSQESKMSKWAVGQTQTLNFTLVDPGYVELPPIALEPHKYIVDSGCFS